MNGGLKNMTFSSLNQKKPKKKIFSNDINMSQKLAFEKIS